MFDWLSQPDFLLVSSIVSITMFVGTLIAIPVLCVRLPEDYFVRPIPKRPLWLVVVRTVAAVVLIIMGIAMLVLPGQGALTILLGISLFDFPAKRRLERRLLRKGPVLRTINRIRAGAHRPPLHAP